MRPTPRMAAPTAWAMPSHTATTPRNSAWKPFATGPVPVRTARGAGRAAGRRDEVRALEPAFEAGLVLPERDEEDFFCGVFRALRVVEPEVFPLLVRALLRAEVDVLVLRDPGGEDVRVAMTPT